MVQHLEFSHRRDRYGCWLRPKRGFIGKPTFTQYERACRTAKRASRASITMQQRQMPSAEFFLESHPHLYTWGSIVRRYGREYTASDRGRYDPPEKPWSCFETASEKARATDEELQYVEGLALSPFGPALHAWNVNGDDVFDFTWPCQHLNRYFGIVFDLAFLEEIGHKHGCVFGYMDPLEKYLKKRRDATRP